MSLANLARVARDTELIQSYLRVADEPEPQPPPEPKQRKDSVAFRPKESTIQTRFEHGKQAWSLSKELKLKKRPRRRKQEELYTDKDRAAAVNMGSRDIKQSLKIKKKEERSKALQIPEETKPGTLLAQAGFEVRARRYDLAFSCITKAIDLNPEDKTALVARSKCYLLLGEPELALKDAEAALAVDPNYIKALLQKAESLYHLGKFEEALVYFHRGLKLRPDMSGFRLGVAKATEAIKNIIGSNSRAFEGTPESLGKLLKGLNTVDDVVKAAEAKKVKPKSHFLGHLQEDKEYLEKVLKEKSDIINLKEGFALNEMELYAREMLDYLSNRGEFWRQQKPKGRG
ncbi:outer dynein arm-docking complex subunit 4 [Halyomorpha halys]|uniref:outer dynein arm-docking complex subunit 4 n=1 Tax=Halyomorpha halys TaxID=286706 RepID=UPI0006D50DFB|nr:tetratricopeptide repeat protein 25 [Halyomorpha halys]